MTPEQEMVRIFHELVGATNNAAPGRGRVAGTPDARTNPMTWRILPALLTLLALTGCAASNYGATLPASPAVNQQTAGDPCQVGGQIYCAINSNVVQANISQTICRPGWTATVRPPSSYTSALKSRQLAAGMNVVNGDRNPRRYEEDHRLALALGGSPADEHNLSPEFADDATPAQPYRNHKDADEVAFQHRVCSGEPLRQAQAEFVNRWLSVYPAYK